MRNSLISIIIPIYNVEPYLRRCLDSVVNQTYTNLEIILIDDGSPDNCPQICDEYAAKDNRIIVIHKENGGLSDARNAGLTICKGDYISFIDSDDWVDEKYIEVLLSLAINKSADIAIAENIKTKSQIHIKDRNVTTTAFTSKEALLKLFCKKNIAFIVSWGKLYKKELFDNLRFPVGKYHEDEFTTYLLFYKSTSIAYTSQVLYYYYSRESSIMATQHPYDALEAFEQRYLFFKEKQEFELLPHLLPPLCWLYLYCSFIEKNNGNLHEAEKLFHALRNYVKEPGFNKVSLFHRFFLKTFVSFPNFYALYRKYSPFLIRKRS